MVRIHLDINDRCCQLIFFNEKNYLTEQISVALHMFELVLKELNLGYQGRLSNKVDKKKIKY